MGIDKDDIEKFEDPEYWLEYFPPLAIQDLKTYGLCADWRRSFITTSKNPYYDSFITWQYHVMREKGKITYGKKPVIYSILDGQPCGDHDVSEGEGATPQEFALVKMQILEFPEEMKEFELYKAYLVSATMRPESIYGQTHCYVHPEGIYGVYRMLNDEYFV